MLNRMPVVRKVNHVGVLVIFEVPLENQAVAITATRRTRPRDTIASRTISATRLMGREGVRGKGMQEQDLLRTRF